MATSRALAVAATHAPDALATALAKANVDAPRNRCELWWRRVLTRSDALATDDLSSRPIIARDLARAAGPALEALALASSSSSSSSSVFDACAAAFRAAAASGSFSSGERPREGPGGLNDSTDCAGVLNDAAFFEELFEPLNPPPGRVARGDGADGVVGVDVLAATRALRLALDALVSSSSSSSFSSSSSSSSSSSFSSEAGSAAVAAVRACAATLVERRRAMGARVASDSTFVRECAATLASSARATALVAERGGTPPSEWTLATAALGAAIAGSVPASSPHFRASLVALDALLASSDKSTRPEDGAAMSAPLLALAVDISREDDDKVDHGSSHHQNGDVLARLFARAALECPRDDVTLLAATRALEAARDAIDAGGGVSPASASVAAVAAGVIASRDGGGGINRAVPNAVDVDAVVGSIVGGAAEPRAASAALAAVRETLALERTPGKPSALGDGDDRFGGSDDDVSNVAFAFLRAHGAAAAAGTRARCALAAAAAAAGDDRARGDHARAVAEGLKLCAAAVTKLASSREGAGGGDSAVSAVSAAVSVFLPLAMDAGAGVGDDERRAAPHPPVPELRAAAAALVRMVAAAAPEGFRHAVAALGSESRSRLQSALAGGGGIATTPGGAAAPGTPPAISLGSMG